jgi:hypothetical protein
MHLGICRAAAPISVIISVPYHLKQIQFAIQKLDIFGCNITSSQFPEFGLPFNYEFPILCNCYKT